MKYPKDMDPKCVPLCNSLNAIPNIRTIESCCGHDRGPFVLWFRMDDRRRSRYLTVVARVFDRRYGGIQGWTCTLDNGDVPEDQPIFMISSGSNKGRVAYNQSMRIAKNIYYTLGHKAFCRMFLGTYPVLESKRSDRKSCDTCGAPCNRAVKQKLCSRWSPLTSVRA